MGSLRVPFHLVVFVLVLAACSEAPREAAGRDPETPPEPVTGQKVFFQMYGAARTWASDVQGLRLESISLPKVSSGAGRYPAWRARFVSPARRRSKYFTYSVIEAYGNLHKGIFEGPEEGWSRDGRAQPWVIAALKVDSDAAYKTALSNSAEYAKKNPGKRVTMVLELTKRHPSLAWRVIWGDSVSTSDYSVFVNASTGDFMGKMR